MAIKVKIQDRIAKCEKETAIVCGNTDYEIEFEFDSEWSSYTSKTARFIHGGQYQEVVFTGNTCTMPIIYEPAIVGVGVYAGNVRTTTPAIIQAVKSITSGDPIHVDPPEDVYTQILDLIEEGAVKGEQGDPGQDGFSPTATVEKVGHTAPITITDKDGTTSAEISDGEQGADGYSPSASVSKSGDTATITITDKNGTTTAQISDGAQGEQGEQGEQGVPGADGFSPTASVSKSNGVATITITDKQGTTSASVSDGVNGTNGTDGTDGFSPIATVSKSGNTATISITDAQGTTTAQVSDGTNGTNGTNGVDGFSPTASVSKSGDTATITITDKNGTTNASVSDGTDGQDGYSPTASVSKSGSTATISITDKNGTTTASVSDGTNGTNGQDGFSPVATVQQVGNEVQISITDAQGTTTANASASGIVETATVSTSGWGSLSAALPYTYYTTITVQTTLTENTVVELINDNAKLFAKHGFAIGSITAQGVIVVYSIGCPENTVQFTFRIGSGTVGGIAEKGMHNYSTDEQVVGTWIDGKTLYEKTYDFQVSDLQNGTVSSSNIQGYLFLDNINYDYIDISKMVVFFPTTSGMNYRSWSYNFRNSSAQIEKSASVNNGYESVWVDCDYKVNILYNYRTYAHIYITVQYTKQTT